MKPVRFPEVNTVYKLEGGTDENDLPIWRTTNEDGAMVLVSEWKPTDEELAQLVLGGTVALQVWGVNHPPVAVYVEPPR